MAVLAAYMVPHPPMIIPDIGRGGEAQIAETIRAYEQVADEIAALKPETILILSPHSVMYSDYFHISPGRKAKGSFVDFRAAKIQFEEEYDEELTDRICLLAEEAGFPAGTLGERDRKLDHGTMVPLWFIRQKLNGSKIVRIGLSGLPLTDHYRFGMMLKEAAEITGRRVVIVASGDLSHKLQVITLHKIFQRHKLTICKDYGYILLVRNRYCQLHIIIFTGTKCLYKLLAVFK